MPNNKTLLYTLILLFTLGQVATDLYLPSLVSITHAFNTDSNMAQFTITAYVSSMMISQPLYGIASDAYGRRNILLIGSIIAILGTFLCCIAWSIKILLLGRFIQGLGASAGLTVCRAIMRDLYSGPNFIKMASYLAVFGMVCMISAPVLGGYIEHFFNWRVNFILLLILCIINLINVIFILPETNLHKHSDHLRIRQVFNNFIFLLKSYNFVIYSICSMLAYANIYAWVTTGPIIIQQVYGLNPIYFGWTYCASGIFYIIGNIFNRRNIHHYGSNKLMMIGFSIQLFSSLILLTTYMTDFINVYVIICSISILMFGVSLVFPNSNAGALNDFTQIAGTASALFSILQTSGAALSSAYIAITSNHSILPVTFCFIILSLTGLCFSLSINNKVKLSSI